MLMWTYTTTLRIGSIIVFVSTGGGGDMEKEVK